MNEAQLYDLLKTAISQVPVIGLLCYWVIQERKERMMERSAREDAEKRERALLREMADCRPEA